MRIEVRLYGALSRYRPDSAAGTGAFEIDVPDGSTVSQVADQLGIPKSWLRSAFVNEQASPKDRALSPGDKVALLPPAGGGSMFTTEAPRHKGNWPIFGVFVSWW